MSDFLPGTAMRRFIRRISDSAGAGGAEAAPESGIPENDILRGHNGKSRKMFHIMKQHFEL